MKPNHRKLRKRLTAELETAQAELARLTARIAAAGDSVPSAAGTQKPHPAIESRNAVQKHIANLFRELRLLEREERSRDAPSEPVEERRLTFDQRLVLGDVDEETVFTLCESKGRTIDELVGEVDSFVRQRAEARRAITEPYLRDQVEGGRHKDPALWERTKATLLAFDDASRTRIAELTGTAPEFNPASLL